MPDETMRAEFEAWAGPEGYPLHRNHKDEADYEYDETKDVWDAWRASRASLAPAGWQKRVKSMDPDDADDPWSSWRAIDEDLLDVWRARAERDPAHYELRQVFARAAISESEGAT